MTALPPVKEPTIFIKHEAGWAPEPVWTFCRKKNLLSFPEIESPALIYGQMCYWPELDLRKAVANVEIQRKAALHS